MKLPKKQISNVRSYCDLNNIEDIDGFILQCFIDGYNIKKYGLIGDTTDSKIIEKEVEKIIEVVKEVKVPFEVIKEVEKVIEVPVEVIKEVLITDDEEVSDLKVKIGNLINENESLSQKLTKFETKPPTIIEKEVPGPTKEVEVIKYVDREVVKEVKVEVPVDKVVTNIVNNCDKIEGEYVTKINELNESFKKEREELTKKLNIQEKTTTFDSTDRQKQLQETLSKLRRELSEKNNKINDLEKTIEDFKSNTQIGAVYMNGSNLKK